MGRVQAIVALQEHHDRFLRNLIDVVRTRTGVSVNRSDVLRALVETAMGLKVSESDVDDAYTKAYGLETLCQSRKAIRSEIRHTETELKQTMTDGHGNGHSLELFRRNLAYQKRRLADVEAQIAQWEQSGAADGNGAAGLVRGLLYGRLRLDGGHDSAD
jgi:hypothetical protein